MSEVGAKLLAWTKEFDLMVSIDGKHYIDPRSRCYVRENHLKSLLRRDVNAPLSVIEKFILGMKQVTVMMSQDPKWRHLIEEIQPSGEYLGSYEP